MRSFLILTTVLFFSMAEACKPRPLEDCARGALIPLEKKTFNNLDSGARSFQKKLDKHLKKALKSAVPWKSEKGLSSCFNNHFSDYYLNAVKAYAREHRGKICSQHVQTLSKQVLVLIHRSSPEYSYIREESARQDLLNKGMDVSEALLYFNNKHTK